MSAKAASTHLVLEWSPRGVILHEPGSRTPKIFASAQAAAHALGNRAVVVAVSRRSMFVRTLRVPNASMSEINQIVRLKLGELFPLPPQDLAFNTELTDDLTPEGRLAVVVAMAASELRRLHLDLKDAGLKIDSVIPVAYGSVALVNSLQLNNAAVVSIDEGGIGIDIVSDGVLRYSRVAADSGSAAAEVCRTYSVAGIPCGEIVAVEGVHVADADVTSSTSPLEALSGVWPSRVPNLELPEMVAQRLARERASNLRLAGMLLIAGLLLIAVDYVNYSDAATKVNDAKAANARELDRLSKQQKSQEAKAKAAAAIVEVLDQGLSPAQRLSDVAIVVGNRVPEGAWLSAFALERGKDLTIRGTAGSVSDVTEFQNRINAADGTTITKTGAVRMPLFRNVRLLGANQGTLNDKPIVMFSISAFPNGNVPLATIKPIKGAGK